MIQNPNLKLITKVFLPVPLGRNQIGVDLYANYMHTSHLFMYLIMKLAASIIKCWLSTERQPPGQNWPQCFQKRRKKCNGRWGQITCTNGMIKCHSHVTDHRFCQRLPRYNAPINSKLQLGSPLVDDNYQRESPSEVKNELHPSE